MKLKMQIVLLLIIMFSLIICYNIYFNRELIEGLSDREVYFKLNKQNLDIDYLNDIYKKKEKEFILFKQQVKNYSAKIQKKLATNVGVA